MSDLPIRFLAPYWLLLLLVIPPLLWWVSRRSLAGLPPLRRVLAFALRMVIVILLVLGLARMQWRKIADRVAVYFLVDASNSIPTQPTRHAEEIRDYIHNAENTRDRGDLMGLIYFGADASCETPLTELPISLERQAIVDPNGTDISSAIRLALATFPGSARKRIVIATDGNQNRGEAFEEIEAARAQGVQVDVYPIIYTHDREITVEKVTMPENVQEGIPFIVRAVIRSTAPTRARVMLKRGGVTENSFEVDLDARRNLIRIPARLDPESGAAGAIGYEVVVAPLSADDDRMVENNRGFGLTRLRGPPQILYVDGNIGMEDGYNPQLYQRLVRTLNLVKGDKEKEVRLHLVSDQDIPDGDTLAGYDCIILDNVSNQSLGAKRNEKIRSLVNNQGVGLIMIGGERSFGAGGYLHTPLERALPVDMDLKHKEVMPNGALAIILHTCEFSNGNYWAKVITNKAIDTLGPSDYVGVLYWSWQGSDTWLFPLQRAVNRPALKSLVNKCQPEDMPGFDGTVNMAVTALGKVPAAARHIIIISDGDPSPPSPKTYKLIRNTKNLTISTVTIGSHSTPILMRKLATMGGGRFYNPTNPKMLPKIFIKEAMVVKRRLFFEEPFVPVLNPDEDELIADILPSTFPTLYGYVGTTQKPAADAALLSANENKDPILAHWQYGLGHAVAFTSDAKNRWGRDWLQWGKFDAFWSGIVWRSLRDQPSNLRMRVVAEGERGRIVVNAVDDDGAPLPFLTLTARVTSPDGKEVPPVQLRQTGLGTYEAEFPADAQGQYHVAVTTPPDTEGVKASAYGGMGIPFPRELENLSSDEPTLSRIAEKGGGRMLTGNATIDNVFNRDLPAARDFQDLWWWCLALAAMLFPLDVLVRRVMIDWGEVWGMTLGKAFAPSEAQREQRMSRLMQAKQSATPERSSAPSFMESDENADKSFDFKPGAGTGEGGATPKPTPSAAPKPKDDAAEEGGYTSRLLKAKKRAQDDRK